MKPVLKVIGWVLILGGIAAIAVIVWGKLTGRIPGNFLAGLLMCSPAILAIVVGGLFTRAGRRQDWVASDVQQWTRRGPA